MATLAATSGLALAGVAVAATPQQIYADAADNGRLDRSYSAADLARYQHDATVAGYGNKIIKIVVKPKVTPRPKVKPPVKQAVAPAQQVSRQQFTPPRSALPFTGSQLATFLTIGIALLAGGFLLRMMTGRRSSDR